MSPAAALLLLVFSLFFAGCNRESPLIGRWEGTDRNNDRVEIQFKQDGTFIARSGGDVLEGTYYANFSQLPVELDLQVVGSKPILTLIKLEGGKLTIQRTEPGKARPAGFSSDSTVYTKVE